MALRRLERGTMHATSFSIRNFRRFNELTLTGLRPFTLLVGHNNVGKTSVLEAFVAALSREPVVAPNTLDRARELLPARGATTTEAFRSLFKDLAIDRTIELDLDGPRLSRQVRVTFETSAASSTLDIGFDESVDQDLTSGSVDGSRLRWQVLREGQEVYSALAWRDPQPKFAGDTRGATLTQRRGYDDTPSRVYLSTSMWLGSEFMDTFSLIRKMGGLQPILDVLATMTPGLTDLQISTYGGEPRLEATVSGTVLPVQLLGDGTVRALTYLLAATRAQGGFLLIDEIERGIHHTALVKVLAALRRRAADAGTQIIATTHSDECIQAAAEAFQDARGSMGVIRLERRDSGHIVARPLPDDGLAAALELGMEVR